MFTYDEATAMLGEPVIDALAGAADMDLAEPARLFAAALATVDAQTRETVVTALANVIAQSERAEE